MFEKKLSEDDRKWIRQAIREELFAALYREITIEKAARGSGEVDGEIEKATENVLDMLVRWLPFTEGALRGSQEDINKATGRMNEIADKVDKLGKAFVEIENPMIVLERFVGLLARTGIMDKLEDIAAIDVMGPETKKIASGG
jgi:hypothetical protein